MHNCEWSPNRKASGSRSCRVCDLSGAWQGKVAMGMVRHCLRLTSAFIVVLNWILIMLDLFWDVPKLKLVGNLSYLQSRTPNLESRFFCCKCKISKMQKKKKKNISNANPYWHHCGRNHKIPMAFMFYWIGTTHPRNGTAQLHLNTRWQHWSSAAELSEVRNGHFMLLTV